MTSSWTETVKIIAEESDPVWETPAFAYPLVPSPMRSLAPRFEGLKVSSGMVPALQSAPFGGMKRVLPTGTQLCQGVAHSWPQAVRVVAALELWFLNSGTGQWA